ncbi:MAG: sigma-70 family RNA polymerase sigma factor [Bacteroidetes bacterium]|nr:sigma-70 family RNA polymerase sigma factor [Bacteroidota bacterium]
MNNYADYLFKVAFYRVNNKEVAEDIVQDTFLSAYKAKETFNGTANEKTWLTTILKNKTLDYLKKASTKNETLLTFTNAEEAPSYDHFFNTKKLGKWQKETEPKDWQKADSLANSKEFYTVLNACLSKLPLKWAAVFNLNLIEDNDSDLVCKELNITSSNLWVIMHRAKLQMRECLEKNWLKL